MSTKNDSKFAPAAESRKTVVTVGLKRLLNTAQYENVEINLQTTDEIEWSSNSDRSRKINNLVTLLNDQFVQTEHQVFAELGVQEKRAWFKESRNSPKAFQGNNTVGDELLA
jgi:DNA polymerase III delta prime subunit